jgi:3-oxoacyl-[acyl-carrier protein] reductase
MTALDGRVAIVTGAASGMGRAHVRHLAGLGAIVVAQDIDPSGLAETVAGLPAAETHEFDIADVPAIDRMAEAVLSRHGRVDILVNNAGIGDDRQLEAIEERHLDRMLGVHVKGTFFCTRAVVPAMKRQRRGRILNVSSRWAQAGHDQASDYIAAKGAILGLTKAWARELAPFGITVNAIAPGGVWSAMVLANLGEAGVRREEQAVPLGRWAQPGEIARIVAHLVSDEAAFVTGQVVSPNGGKTMVGI